MISLPPFEPGPRIAVSASSFLKFRQCPDQGLAHYRGIYGEPSRPSFVGQLVHRLIARDLSSGRIDDVAQAAREEIGSTNLNWDMTQAVGKPSDIKRAISEASEVYERFCLLPRPELAEVEISVSVDVGDNVVLKGRIDGVQMTDSGVRILDWKTGPIRAEAAGQLQFYGLLWALEREVPATELQAISIQTGERATFGSSAAELEEMGRQIAQLVNQVRRSWQADVEIGRHPGPWCRYCAILSDCEQGGEAVSLLS